MEGTRLLFVEDDEAISLGLEYSFKARGTPCHPLFLCCRSPCFP